MNTNLLREDLVKLLEENDVYLKDGLKKIYNQYIGGKDLELFEKLFNNSYSNFDEVVKELLERNIFYECDITEWIENYIDIDAEININIED